MNDTHLSTIEEVEAFVKAGEKLSINIESREERYNFISSVALRFRYKHQKKKQRGILLKYVQKLTGYKASQAKRLITNYYSGKLKYAIQNQKRNSFPLKYKSTDVALLIKTDVLHNCLSGEATRRILQREVAFFGNKKYTTISQISSSYIYYIRNNNRQYNSSEARFFTRTQATQVNIGIRRKPKPNGSPGFLRVDTVHQGDQNGQKSLYHINIVDEVTQYEMIATVERISEAYLRPVLTELLTLFPFVIHEFHSDNGSEYINKIVAELLNKLHIELTKSRSRHSNDNALVESKNGSVIRKLYGRNFIPKEHAKAINEFNKQYVNIYLNYHRPCGFATPKIDHRGKEKKKYDIYLTPYEKLKSLDNAKQYLKDNVAFESIDKIAYAKSDNEFAENMNKAKTLLFKKIRT